MPKTIASEAMACGGVPLAAGDARAGSERPREDARAGRPPDASASLKNEGRGVAPALGLATLAGLAVYSQRNFLVFHTVVEMASVGVAFAVFAFGWNARRYPGTGHVVALGVGYLFIGTTDLLHTLAYEGMNIFEGGGANMSTQLWIAGRYLEATTLLAAPLLIGRRVRPAPTMLLGAAAFSALALSIFHWGVFPDCFVGGLTTFKNLSEFAVCLVIGVAIALVWRQRDRLDRAVTRLLVASMGLTIVSELVFTLYQDVYGLTNMSGHVIKAVSFYLIYKAVIQAGFARPYGTLFHGLMERDRALVKARESLEARVAERTAELDSANRTMQQEVLERQRTATALAESERRYRLLVEQTPAVTFSAPVNPKDGGVYVSPQVRELLGFDPQDFEAGWHTWHARIHPDDRERARAEAAKCREPGQRCRHEYRMVRSDGDVAWVAESSIVIEDERGRPWLQGVVYDVTQRKWADQAAAEIRRLHYTSAVADTVPLPLVALDERLDVIYANRTYCEAFRAAPEEVEGRNLAELAGGCWSDPRLLKAARRALDDGKADQPIVIQDHFPGIGRRIVRVSTQRLFAERSQPPRLLLAMEDITEENEFQERLMRTERLAALGQLAGSVAHEIRNPLSAVRSGAYFLKMALDTREPDVAEALDIIEREVGRSDRIITNLLDYGRDKRISAEATDLNAIAQRALDEAAIPAGVRVETDLREDIPPVMADPEQIGQVLANLVANAVAAMPRGGTLTVGTRSQGPGRAVAYVRDTGDGIAPEQQERVFEPLVTTRATGIGLGLAVCKSIVSKHGGEISLWSREGEGSEFSVALPAASLAAKAKGGD